MVVAGGRVVVVAGDCVVVVGGWCFVAAEAVPASAGLRERQVTAKPTSTEAMIPTEVLSTRMDSPMAPGGPYLGWTPKD